MYLLRIACFANVTGHYRVAQLRMEKRLQKVLADSAPGPEFREDADEQQGSKGEGKAQLVKSGKGNGNKAAKEGGDGTRSQLYQILHDIKKVKNFLIPPIHET